MEVKMLNRADCWVLWKLLQMTREGFPKGVAEKMTKKFGSFAFVKPTLSWNALAEVCALYPGLKRVSEGSNCPEVIKLCLYEAGAQLCQQADVMRSLLYSLYKDELHHSYLPHLSATFYYTFRCLKGRLPEEGWLKEVGLSKISQGWCELQNIGRQSCILFCKDGRLRNTYCWKMWGCQWPDGNSFQSSHQLKEDVKKWLDGLLTYPHLRYWGDYNEWVGAALEELMNSPMASLSFEEAKAPKRDKRRGAKIPRTVK